MEFSLNLFDLSRLLPLLGLNMENKRVDYMIPVPPSSFDTFDLEELPSFDEKNAPSLPQLTFLSYTKYKANRLCLKAGLAFSFLQSQGPTWNSCASQEPPAFSHPSPSPDCGGHSLPPGLAPNTLKISAVDNLRRPGRELLKDRDLI